MSQAPATPVEVVRHGRPAVPPVTPGKVAVWLFLATEIMFFTGLIGSYIVLRSGSPDASYSNLFPPGSPLASEAGEIRGLLFREPVARAGEVARLIAPLQPESLRYSTAQLEDALARGHVLTPVVLPEVQAAGLAKRLEPLGARLTLVSLESTSWPRPYNPFTNPLSIDLTALNTFILICSSVTMVLALSAIQRGQRWLCSLYLLGTLLIGGTFLGVQVYEYRELLFHRLFPIGISPTGHFTPDVSLFASCFFTMTGFHGAHVAGGLIALLVLLLRTVFGSYTRTHHAPVELVGLYWHFVDLVWILLFTVVYLI